MAGMEKGGVQTWDRLVECGGRGGKHSKFGKRV